MQFEIIYVLIMHSGFYSQEKQLQFCDNTMTRGDTRDSVLLLLDITMWNSKSLANVFGGGGRTSGRCGL
jgi:hypothetical protein